MMANATEHSMEPEAKGAPSLKGGAKVWGQTGGFKLTHNS